jgi:hypothetical protein
MGTGSTPGTRTGTGMQCELTLSIYFCLSQVVVIDGRGHMLGRLASIVSKQLLQGQHVVSHHAHIQACSCRAPSNRARRPRPSLRSEAGDGFGNSANSTLVSTFRVWRRLGDACAREATHTTGHGSARAPAPGMCMCDPEGKGMRRAAQLWREGGRGP